MKAIVQKILLFFRDLFFHLRVAVTLHIGREKVSKENQNEADNEESAERDYYDK